MPRRKLVLTNEPARDPMRAIQPPGPASATPAPPVRWRLTSQDLRDFLLAYCACFLAVSLFIW